LFIIEASISAARLVFTNIKLDLHFFTAVLILLTCAITLGSTPNSFAFFSSLFVFLGFKTSISIAFVESVSVFTTCIFSRPQPAKNFATSSGFPTVADRHIRWKSPASSAIRSNATASCVPRLEFANSCTSSIITYCKRFQILSQPFSRDHRLCRFRCGDEHIRWV